MALYTQLKSIVQNHEKDNEGETITLMENVQNKVRIRLGMKKNQITSNLPIQPSEQAKCFSSFTHKELNIKVIHEGINFNFMCPFETSIEIDLPITNNYGAIEIFFSENNKNGGFLPNIKDPQVSSMHIPVQTIYNMIYNKNKLKKKSFLDSKTQSTHNSHITFKQKYIELKNTKVSVNLEYKGLGNKKSFYFSEPEDIYES